MEAKMRVFKVALLMLLCVNWQSAFSMDKMPGKWLDPAPGRGSRLVERTGEKYLADRENYTAGAVIFALPAPIQLVTPVLAALLRDQPGLLKLEEAKSTNFGEVAKSFRAKSINQYAEELEQHRLRQASEKLTSSEFSPNNFNETRFSSNLFNLLKGADESSQIVIHLIDAKTLFAVEGTIAIMYRWDTWKQWGFENIHDPLSFGKNTIKVRLFTESEFKLLEQATKKLNISYRFAPIGPNYPNEYATEFKALRQWLIQVNNVKK
jgi:hypothetical protein